MAEARLITGASRSGRAQAIDNLLLERWGRALLIVPTRRVAQVRLRDVLERGTLPGVLGRPVVTFQEFAERLIGNRTTRITALEQRILLDKAIDTIRAGGGLASLRDAASTQGFVNHMQRVIAQLKQAAIDPPAFRSLLAERVRSNELDAIVSSVYEAYQEALKEKGVLDLQGMYWVAHDRCSKGKPEGLNAIDCVLLDGFDDFTPSEFRLLEALAPHVQELVFGLNHDTRPTQQDLYTLTEDTSKRVASTFRPVSETLSEAEPATATEFLSAWLFARDEPRRPGDLKNNLVLCEYHSVVHEMESVARRIKRLIREENVAPETIAVVARNLKPVAALARDVFDECGVPARVFHDFTLEDSAVAAFLLRLFEAFERSGRDAVVDVLTSVWFNPTNAARQDSTSFAILARAARIVEGSKEWPLRLERLRKRLDEDGGQEIQGLLRTLPCAREACDTLLDAWRIFHDFAEAFPARATASEFAEALDRLIEGLCLPEALDEPGAKAVQEFEAICLRSMRAMLGTLSEWHAYDTEAVSRADFLLLLRRTFALTTVALPMPPTGVAVHDLESARHLRFDYVFFMGLTQGEMPSPAPSNAIYSERDLDTLRKLGVHLDDASLHSRKELLLFHRIFSIARKMLYLSWHRITPNGQECLPSIFIQDVRTLFPDLQPNRPDSELRIAAPAPDDVASLRDARNTALCGEYAIEVGEQALFRRALVGAEVERDRYGAEPPGPYDGAIATPSLRASLDDRYGPNHEYSVSQLETYASCGFRFFMERVLSIHSVETPREGLDPLVRGTLMHDALEAFHREYRGRGVSDIDENEAIETMDRIAREGFDSTAWRFATLTPGVARIEAERLGALLQRYLRQERARDDGIWKPTFFEAAFGSARHEEGEDPFGAEPFIFDTAAGRVLFSGRIDRIDTSDAGFCIIDYKSSDSIKPKDMDEGSSFQLSVYALAADEYLTPRESCRVAYYLPVGKNKRRRAIDRDDQKTPWDERIETARTAISKAVTGIRAGHFSPTLADKKCRFCPAENVCRYERGRMQRKTGA